MQFCLPLPFLYSFSAWVPHTTLTQVPSVPIVLLLIQSSLFHLLMHLRHLPDKEEPLAQNKVWCKAFWSLGQNSARGQTGEFEVIQMKGILQENDFQPSHRLTNSVICSEEAKQGEFKNPGEERECL